MAAALPALCAAVPQVQELSVALDDGEQADTLVDAFAGLRHMRKLKFAGECFVIGERLELWRRAELQHHCAA